MQDRRKWRFSASRSARLWEPPRAVVQQLAKYGGSYLIAVYNQLAGPLAEQPNFILRAAKRKLQSCQASVAALERQSG